MLRKIMVIAYGLSIASFLCFFALDEFIFLVIGGSGQIVGGILLIITALRKKNTQDK